MQRPVTLRPLALALMLAAAPAWADPPSGNPAPPPSADMADEVVPQVPQRERDFIQIIEDARKEARVSHSLKDVRMGLQIRVMNFYQQSHELEGWQGTVKATHVTEDGDVWISIAIDDGITLTTSPTRAADRRYLTLLKGGTPLAKIAAGLKTGQPVLFTATLFRYVNDSDDDMINNPRLLGHFTSLKPLQ
jgi:hypothetical protein